jgi:hypothetical protein
MNAPRLPAILFDLGKVVATPNALQHISMEDILKCLQRHQVGDWGVVDAEDWHANNRALQKGGRLFSVYNSPHDVPFWIITEADHSVTTILLPEDY